LVGFESEKNGLDDLDVKVIAISVDPEDKAKEVADEVSFPVGFGATRADSDAVGAWWGDARGIIQPSEFILGEDGKVVFSSYSSGPLGRLDASDAIKLVKFQESSKK
jgi:peroxiredoxin